MYFGKKGDLVRIVFLLVIVVGILLLFLNVGGITGGVIGVSSIGHPELDEFSSSSLNVQPNAGVGDSFEGSVPKTSFSTAGGEQLSIQGTIEISDCGTLNLSGEVYELSSDVNTGGTCFSFINDSITLDCKNYQVTYSNGGQGFGVNSTGNYTNLIVRNCKLFDASLGGGSNAHGINFVNALNVTIHNNTIITSDESSHGIFLSNVSFFNITGNNISTSSDLSGGKGIFLNYSLNGSVYLNNITNSQTGAEGIYLNFTNLTTISYNNVTIYADDTAGIYLGDSYLNTVAYNNIINNGTSDTSSYGVYSTSASNADVINNLSFNTIRVGVNGIYLLNSENSTLEGNNINVSVLSSFGIDTSNSDYTKIRSNIISTQGTGIRVQSSSENIVTYNNLSSTASASLGIYLLTVRDSNISFNRVNTTIGNGIKSDFSLSNSIRNNFINISIGNGAGSSFALDLRDGGQTDIFDNELYFTGGTSIGIETFEFTNSNFRTNLIVGNTAQYGLELEATSGNSTFSNNTFLGTYVKTIEDLNITNILIYNNSFGKIKWEAANITTNISLEVGNTIYLQNNLVGLINNVNSLALNKTNKIIQIEIKGLPYIGTPYLFKDGSNCGSFVDPICNITSYDASSGLLTANVSSFSNYSAGDPNPPTFSNASNTSISFKRYENFTANITIDDNISGLSSYIFSTNNSGTWVNDSVVSISGVQYNASVSKNISLAKNNQVCWYYWANDTSSNNLTSTTYCFTVQNTPPSFNESLTAQDAYTGLEFNYDINCSDVDGDNITYYDNTTLFNIDPSTGLINDTSDETEVGAYSIKITCGDDGSNTEQTFTYTINDLNAPTFSNAVNTSANFRRYENFTANITLADGVALDYYLFSTNASGSWVNVSRDINGAQYNASEQANITLAKNNEVCWYYWVNDTAGNEATWLTYCFTVQNTLPSFNESLTAQNAYSEVEFNYDINCSDIDGDSVTYYDNTTLFEINSTTGLINYTPLQAEAGVYFINITCGDGESNTSQTFTYTINDINVPTFSNAVNTSANFRRYENFTANITIDEGLNLSSYTFSTNASGTWQNISNVSISGAQYNASTQANITLAKNNQVCWYYWANDTSSNNATSTTYCFTVQNTIPTHSIPLLNSTNSSTNDTNQNLTAYNQSTVDIDGDSVKNIYNWKVNGTSIIVLNMPFEGINGTTTTNAWDYSGNGNNGSENGGVIWNSSGGYDGKGVYDFDGINDKITTTFGFPELTEITVSTWIKPMESNVITQCTQGGTLFCPIMGSVNNFLWEILNGYLTLFNYNTNTLAWTTASLRNFVDQNWNHAVFTYWSDGSVGNLTFYSNGVYAGSFQSADLNGTFNVSNLIIGDDVSRWWNGSIDEVLIFDRILSAEQVIALYNNRTDLIVSQEISAGDNWSVEITPNDGSEDGAMLESNGVLIQAVPDTTSPTFSNAVNTSANFRRYENFTANITIDNTALDYYIFSSNSSGSWVNVSRDINGAQYNASEQANISLAKNNQICWYYWANDTSSNNATSITYCFTVQNTPPSFNESLTAQTTSSGVEFNYNINCSDIDGDTVIYYDNTTLFDINSTTGLINDTPLQAEAGVYSINITCGDGEVNTSQTFTYTINDITAPSFSNAVNTSANFRRYENFTANITINDSTLDYYIFSTNASGSWVNVSRDINGAQYNASEQANITLAKNNPVCWYYWANDTFNNNANSSLQCFTVANTPVQQSVTMPTVSLDVGTTTTINLSTYFIDVDGDEINYSIVNISVANFTINNTDKILSITGLSAGSSSTYVNATEGANEVQGNNFTVTVSAVSTPPSGGGGGTTPSPVVTTTPSTKKPIVETQPPKAPSATGSATLAETKSYVEQGIVKIALADSQKASAETTPQKSAKDSASFVEKKILKITNNANKPIIVSAVLDEQLPSLENEENARTFLSSKISSEGLSPEQQAELEKQLNILKLIEKLDIRPMAVAMKTSLFGFDPALTMTKERIMGNLLESKIKNINELQDLEVASGQVLEKEVLIKRGLSLEKDRPINVAFTSVGEKIFSQKLTFEEKTLPGTVTDYDPEKNILDLYVLIPPSEEGADLFTVEIAIDNKVSQENLFGGKLFPAKISSVMPFISLLKHKTIYGEVFGPYKVEKGTLLATQFDTSKLHGESELVGKIYRDGSELISTDKIDLTFK